MFVQITHSVLLYIFRYTIYPPGYLGEWFCKQNCRWIPLSSSREVPWRVLICWGAVTNLLNNGWPVPHHRRLRLIWRQKCRDTWEKIILLSGFLQTDWCEMAIDLFGIYPWTCRQIFKLIWFVLRELWCIVWGRFQIKVTSLYFF